MWPCFVPVATRKRAEGRMSSVRGFLSEYRDMDDMVHVIPADFIISLVFDSNPACVGIHNFPNNPLGAIAAPCEQGDAPAKLVKWSNCVVRQGLYPQAINYLHYSARGAEFVRIFIPSLHYLPGYLSTEHLWIMPGNKEKLIGPSSGLPLKPIPLGGTILTGTLQGWESA